MSRVDEIKDRFHKTGEITQGEYEEAYEQVAPFGDLPIIQCHNLEMENAKRNGTLVFADEWCWMYKWQNILYVCEPGSVLHFSPPLETAHPEKIYTAAEMDRGIREAGFAADPLIKALEDIARIAGEHLGS